eukprot:10932771-Alexandrium_andersonii.AAC.1
MAEPEASPRCENCGTETTHPYLVCSNCGLQFFPDREIPAAIGIIAEGVDGGGMGAAFAETVGEPAERGVTRLVAR